MKESIKSMLFLLLIFAIHADADQKILSDLYKTGKILLRPELALDDQSMPKGVIFESPFDIEEDPRGNVYVLDYRANNIKIFSSEGKFINTIGRQGQGPGEFNGPFFLAVTKDRIYVWDFRNRRICVLTPDGKFIGYIQIVGEANLPWRNSRIVDHSFWAIKMNSDESQVKIVRYQISSISGTQ